MHFRMIFHFHCIKFVKVIPQKKMLLNNFFKILLKCSSPMSVSKKYNKKDRSMACLGDMKDKTYPINACIGTNHTAFCCSWKQGFLNKHFKKTWQVESLKLMEQFGI